MLDLAAGGSVFSVAGRCTRFCLHTAVLDGRVMSMVSVRYAPVLTTARHRFHSHTDTEIMALALSSAYRQARKELKWPFASIL